jgi:hypothetical protein
LRAEQPYQEMAAPQIKTQHPNLHLADNAAQVTHIVMTQLSMKAGLHHWGDCDTDTVSEELSALLLQYL